MIIDYFKILNTQIKYLKIKQRYNSTKQESSAFLLTVGWIVLFYKRRERRLPAMSFSALR